MFMLVVLPCLDLGLTVAMCNVNVFCMHLAVETKEFTRRDEHVYM